MFGRGRETRTTITGLEETYVGELRALIVPEPFSGGRYETAMVLPVGTLTRWLTITLTPADKNLDNEEFMRYQIETFAEATAVLSWSEDSATGLWKRLRSQVARGGELCIYLPAKNEERLYRDVELACLLVKRLHAIQDGRLGLIPFSEVTDKSFGGFRGLFAIPARPSIRRESFTVAGKLPDDYNLFGYDPGQLNLKPVRFIVEHGNGKESVIKQPGNRDESGSDWQNGTKPTYGIEETEPDREAEAPSRPTAKFSTLLNTRQLALVVDTETAYGVSVGDVYGCVQDKEPQIVYDPDKLGTDEYETEANILCRIDPIRFIAKVEKIAGRILTCRYIPGQSWFDNLTGVANVGRIEVGTRFLPLTEEQIESKHVYYPVGE